MPESNVPVSFRFAKSDPKTFAAQFAGMKPRCHIPAVAAVALRQRLREIRLSY